MPDGPTARAAAFTEIFRTNHWQDPESVSGPGSTLARTADLRAALPALLRELGARSLLDLGCGDARWIARTPLRGIRYTGVDLVAPLVRRARLQHGWRGLRFRRLDIVEGPLPRADVVLCRDALIHLTDASIARVLANVRRSGSAYLLTSTFRDHDHAPLGPEGEGWGWRTVNLERPPFALPAPLRTIPDTPRAPGYEDKVLALWPASALPDAPSP